MKLTFGATAKLHTQLIVTCLLLSFSLSGFSQMGDELIIHYKQDIHYETQSPVIDYGISVEQFVSEFVSLNYNFSYAKYDESKHHIHAAAGPVIGIPTFFIGAISSIGCGKEDGYWEEEWNSNTAEWDSIWVDTTDPDKAERCSKAPLYLLGGLLLTFIPEGVNFHIPVIYDRIRLSPYVNLAGVDFIRDKTLDETRIRWSFGGGAKLTLQDSSNFVNLTGYAGFKGNRELGLNGHYGLQLGFRVN